MQDNAVIHVSENYRTIIGDDVTVGHCATLEDCVIDSGALIGTNAVVLNQARVGARTLIAAGSVVPSGANIPPEVLAAGAPAVVKKKLEGAALNWVGHAGPEYVKLSRSYLQHGIGDPDIHEVAVATLD